MFIVDGQYSTQSGHIHSTKQKIYNIRRLPLRPPVDAQFISLHDAHRLLFSHRLLVVTFPATQPATLNTLPIPSGYSTADEFGYRTANTQRYLTSFKSVENPISTERGNRSLPHRPDISSTRSTTYQKSLIVFLRLRRGDLRNQ